jgi:hypothetical protein
LPLGAQGEFALVKEYMEAALKLHGQPVRRGSMPHEHDVYALLADAAARRHDAAALQQYVPLAEELAARDAHPHYLAMAHRARGVMACLAGEYTAAEANLQQALGEFRRMGVPWQEGRTWLELGDLAFARTNASAARDCFTQALAIFEGIGAKPDAARARAALEGSG